MAATFPILDDPSIKILAQLGAGGQGRVYLATKDDRDLCVVKVLGVPKSSDRGPMGKVEGNARLQDEISILWNLKDPGIPEIMGRGFTADDETYMVLEYVNGGNLLEIVQSRLYRLDRPVALGIAKGICEICQRLYLGGGPLDKQDLLHRDLKAENIMLNSLGQVKIVDWGIAGYRGKKDITKSFILGSPRYLAPELREGMDRASVLSEIYSIGVVIYLLLSGERIYEQLGEDTLAQYWADMKLVYPPHAKLNELENLVVAKALHKEPARRFQSPMEFFNALQAAAGVPACSQNFLGNWIQGKTDGLVDRHKQLLEPSHLEPEELPLPFSDADVIKGLGTHTVPDNEYNAAFRAVAQTVADAALPEELDPTIPQPAVEVGQKADAYLWTQEEESTEPERVILDATTTDKVIENPTEEPVAALAGPKKKRLALGTLGPQRASLQPEDMVNALQTGVGSNTNAASSVAMMKQARTIENMKKGMVAIIILWALTVGVLIVMVVDNRRMKDQLPEEAPPVTNSNKGE